MCVIAVGQQMKYSKNCQTRTLIVNLETASFKIVNILDIKHHNTRQPNIVDEHSFLTASIPSIDRVATSTPSRMSRIHPSPARKSTIRDTTRSILRCPPIHVDDEIHHYSTLHMTNPLLHEHTSDSPSQVELCFHIPLIHVSCPKVSRRSLIGIAFIRTTQS
jgi:hypothetical protein